jgi:hypothetical protein
VVSTGVIVSIDHGLASIAESSAFCRISLCVRKHIYSKNTIKWELLQEEIYYRFIKLVPTCHLPQYRRPVRREGGHKILRLQRIAAGAVFSRLRFHFSANFVSIFDAWARVAVLRGLTEPSE